MNITPYTLTALALLGCGAATACPCDGGAAPEVPAITSPDDIKRDGSTLLHEVCKQGGSPEIIRMLVDYGADVNRPQDNERGDTPLMLLVAYGRGDISNSVRTLLSLGADTLLLNKQGKSALYYARGRGMKEVEQLLEAPVYAELKRGEQKGDRELILEAVAAGADINQPDEFNATALSRTYFSDNIGLAEFLLGLGANPNLLPQVNGRHSALPFAQCQKYDNTAMIELLHRHGLQINAQGHLGDRYLITAANGNPLHTRWALEHGADASLTDSQGRSVLMAATTAEIAGLVLNAAPLMLHHTDEDGNSAMHHAAMKGSISPGHAGKLWTINHKTSDGRTLGSYKNGLGAKPQDVCRLLHQAGLGVNDSNRAGQTPLMLAAETGDVALCRCLIELGADVSKVDSSANSALSYAQRSANEELISLLRKNGAPAGAEDELLQAAATGDEEKVSLLLQNGLRAEDKIAFAALEKAVFAGHEGVARKLVLRGADIHTKNAAGQHLLQLAIQANNRPATEMLLRLGASPYHTGRLANTRAGGNAMATAVGAGHIEMMQLLLDHGMDLKKNPHDTSATLNLAARLGRADMLNLLLDNGANIEGGVNDSGRTAMLTAVTAGQTHIVQQLLKRGVQPEKRNGEILQEAIRKRHPDIVRLLLAAGADANRTDNYNRNVLSQAACFNPPEVIDMLIKAGAQVNLISADHFRSTPLINACKLQKQDPVEVVRLLLAAGADASLKDASGKTALDYATERGHTQSAELLQQAK